MQLYSARPCGAWSTGSARTARAQRQVVLSMTVYFIQHLFLGYRSRGAVRDTHRPSCPRGCPDRPSTMLNRVPYPSSHATPRSGPPPGPGSALLSSTRRTSLTPLPRRRLEVDSSRRERAGRGGGKGQGHGPAMTASMTRLAVARSPVPPPLLDRPAPGRDATGRPCGPASTARRRTACDAGPRSAPRGASGAATARRRSARTAAARPCSGW